MLSAEKKEYKVRVSGSYSEVESVRTVYTYQWQVYNPKTGEWVDLKGFKQPTLSRENIEKKWDG
ncbi:MAG: hypothetical protein IJH25_17240, partial [Clostridia bacterium]|nr:hypothetical protein [Clostridia bacterium]